MPVKNSWTAPMTRRCGLYSRSRIWAHFLPKDPVPPVIRMVLLRKSKLIFVPGRRVDDVLFVFACVPMPHAPDPLVEGHADLETKLGFRPVGRRYVARRSGAGLWPAADPNL